MYLENLVIDAVEPQRLGRFWEAVVGGERLTDEPAVLETRLTVEGSKSAPRQTRPLLTRHDERPAPEGTGRCRRAGAS